MLDIFWQQQCDTSVAKGWAGTWAGTPGREEHLSTIFCQLGNSHIDLGFFSPYVQTDFRAWLRDFRVRIILTFVPHEMEEGQAGKAGGKKHPSRQEAFGM